MSKFKPGESGNYRGRPVGALSKKIRLGKLLEPHAKEIIEKVVDLAKNGEPTALRLCMERLIPKVKNEPINIDLPDVDFYSNHDLLKIGEQIIHAVSLGEMTPQQGYDIMTILSVQRKAIEICRLEDRIREKNSQVSNALEKSFFSEMTDEEAKKLYLELISSTQ